MAITQATLQASRQLRIYLSQVNAQQTAVLTRAWVQAWETLLPEFEVALTELMNAAATDTISARTVARSKRIQDALQDSLTVLEDLARLTNSTVIGDIPRVLIEAVDRHVQEILSQLPPEDIQVINFARTDPNALAAVVERTTEQITSLTRPMPVEQTNVMRQELVRGIALGAHPDVVARRILRRTEGGFAGGLQRAVNVARTELLDAHREATRRNALANRDVLKDWVWQCSLDSRTCPSCWAMHGTVHPLEEFGPIDHPQGRCSRIDRTKSWADILGIPMDEPEDILPDAKTVFDGLPESDQLQIMGRKRLDLLNQGEISWDDLSTKKTSPGWRDSQVVTPLKDLIPD